MELSAVADAIKDHEIYVQGPVVQSIVSLTSLLVSKY